MDWRRSEVLGSVLRVSPEWHKLKPRMGLYPTAQSKLQRRPGSLVGSGICPVGAASQNAIKLAPFGSVRAFDHFCFEFSSLPLFNRSELRHGTCDIAAVAHLQALKNPFMSYNRVTFHQPSKGRLVLESPCNAPQTGARTAPFGQPTSWETARPR